MSNTFPGLGYSASVESKRIFLNKNLNIVFSTCFSLSEQVTLLFVGDLSFSGPVKYYVERGYHTYNDSFNDVAPYIREADISVANL